MSRSRFTMADVDKLPEQYREQVYHQLSRQLAPEERSQGIESPPPLTKSGRGYEWSADAEAWLRKYYPKFGKLWCSKMFDVPEGVVRSKASKLGLKSGYRKAAIAAIGTNPSEESRRRRAEAQREAWPEERRQAMSVSAKERIARQGHPKGFRGRRHTPETRATMGVRSKECWDDPGHRFNSEEFRELQATQASQQQLGGQTNALRPTNARGGTRSDLGIFVRSGWEANYARYLNFLVKQGEVTGWEYEPKTFKFEKISRGVMSYTPDFRVVYPDGRVEWHEVKGWLTQRGRTALNRMSKYYPGEVVVLIDKKRYQAIARSVRSFIPRWE